MAILLTGGTTAQTSLRLAELCQRSNIPFVLASRRGGTTSSATLFPTVNFDFTDPSTYPNPFSSPDILPHGERITTVYMIIPYTSDPEKHMVSFINYAIDCQAVKRFVLMAGTTCSLGGQGSGQVWKHLVDRKVEYAVCRPTWFQGEFLTYLDSTYLDLFLGLLVHIPKEMVV